MTTLRLRLLGGFEIERAGRVELTRLPSRAAALLLARLALQPRRQHPREELVELLWPGVELDVGRNRLRQTLSTLRALLETQDAPLFNADRQQVSLLPGALTSDVADFEATRALVHYGGELLPGHFDDWVVAERHRLAALAEAQPATRPPVVHTASPAAAPLQASLATSLPRYLTRYFAPPGRLEALAAQLPHRRLLILIGPGGVGKTRLAVELAWRQFSEQHWSCGMAALAEVRDEAALVSALERALTVTRGGGWPALEAALQDAGAVRLLVLDNAEQALGIVAAAVQRLLAAAPELCLVVTSRHALEVDGETLVDVLPLADAQDTALALFIDRARAVRADFHASRDNQAALAELIGELEGLPLALELAAARVRSFSPAQMLAQWRETPPDGSALPNWLANPTRAPRHASVAGLLDWSLRLLGPEPLALLQRLAALPGAFSWADVAALDGTPAVLSELTGHSLVQTGDDAEPRYRMLELLRRGVLARVPVAEQRAARSSLRAALCDWAQALGLQAPITDWQPRRDIARGLIGCAAEDDDAATGLRLALAMRPCWESDGVDRLLVDQLGQLLQRVPPSSAGHELRAQLAFTHGDRALALAEAELAIQHAGTDPAARAPALVRRAWVLLAGDNREQGQTRPLEEAVSLARRAGDVATEARAWQQLAAIAVSRGQPAQAEALYARAQDLWEALGHARQAAARLRNRAQCLIEIGDVATAVEWITACQRMAETEGDGVGQLDAAYTLAMAHESRRDWAAAVAAARQALRIAHARQHLHARALALQLFARPLARLRQPEQALQLAAFAARYWERHLGALGAREARALALVRRLAAAQLGRERAATAWASGQTLGLAQALAIAGA